MQTNTIVEKEEVLTIVLADIAGGLKLPIISTPIIRGVKS